MANFNETAYKLGIYINGQHKMSTAGQRLADTTAFGTYHMYDAPALFEPQRTSNFEFQVGAALNQKLIESGNNPYEIPTEGNLRATEVIRISVDLASVPHFSQQPIEVKRGNSSLKYAGVPQFETETIKLKDYIGVRAKEALMAWQNLSYNVLTEKVGLAADYKIDCYLKEYTPDYQLIRTWKLYGCWIQNLQETGFSSDSTNGVNEITATICYDRARPENDEL